MARCCERLRPLTAKPLIVKLTPNVGDVGAVADGGRAGGADALSLINTLRAMAIDPRTGGPWLGAGSGGLSGPAVRAVALEMVHDVAARTGFRWSGWGDRSGRDALDFIAAGATCVAVGTENFRDPAAGDRACATKLAQLLAKRAPATRTDDAVPARC